LLLSDALMTKVGQDGAMFFVLGLVIGSIVGVVVERVVGHPIDHFVIKPILQARRRSGMRKAAEAVNLGSELCEVAGTALFVHQFVPAGFAWANMSTRMESNQSTLANRLSRSSSANLLPSAIELEVAVKDWTAQLDADDHFWNGTSLALSRCEISRSSGAEEAKILLSFREEVYATACAIEQAWQSLPLDQRRDVDGNDLRQVDPLLSNSFGLNCTLETADGFVLLTRRSDYARGWQRCRHISFNEGLSTMDRSPGGIVDLNRGFARGLHEELGIDASQIPNFQDRLVVHTVLLDVDRYQWGLLAHLNLEGTDITSVAIQIARNLGAAPDDWEASELTFLPFSDSPKDVIAELQGSEPWVSHGLLNLALSAVHRHPTSAREIRTALISARQR